MMRHLSNVLLYFCEVKPLSYQTDEMAWWNINFTKWGREDE
jgi:hypothetical protein